MATKKGYVRPHMVIAYHSETKKNVYLHNLLNIINLIIIYRLVMEKVKILYQAKRWVDKILT